jgi:hypothetical protein
MTLATSACIGTVELPEPPPPNPHLLLGFWGTAVHQNVINNRLHPTLAMSNNLESGWYLHNGVYSSTSSYGYLGMQYYYIDRLLTRIATVSPQGARSSTPISSRA